MDTTITSNGVMGDELNIAKNGIKIGKVQMSCEPPSHLALLVGPTYHLSYPIGYSFVCIVSIIFRQISDLQNYF